MPTRLNNLGFALYSRFNLLRKKADLNDSIDCFQQAAESLPSSPFHRFGPTLQWARMCAEHRTSSLLQAYTQAMALLPQIVWLGNAVHNRYKRIADVGSVTTEASAAAIRMGNFALALEWLEQGRSIVWKQMLQLRTPFDDLYAVKPALSDELKQVASDLDFASLPKSTEGADLADAPILENLAQQHHRLADRWEELIDEVRRLPGFEAFLRPRKTSQLVRSAQSGPVVVINVYKTSCDALVIRPGSADIAHIPLSFSYERATKAHAQLVRFSRTRGLATRGIRVGLAEPKDDFGRMLSMLWAQVVMPVLDFLGYMQCPPSGDLPHITWCPTGPLSFLPLHAAGDYTAERMVFNYVVSSYTPTLSALLLPPACTPFSGILAVGQELTPDMPSLPGTTAELARIKERCKEALITRLDGELATPTAVLDGMEEHSWVHLACHATQNTTDPLQSAFYLHNGVLDLATITRRPLKRAELAFLSACQTATGDESLSEEAVHLAAGMLMAGYRTVIATIWPIGDEDAPLVTEKVYEHLMAGGAPDGSRAAVAVHKATKYLRDKVGGKEFVRWVPYIHIGL